MLASKYASAKPYSSPKSMPVTARNHEALTLNTLESQGTEEQQDRIRKLINEVRRGGPMSPNAILVPQTELNRMRNSAIILTKEEILQQKKILEEQMEKQQAAAKAKKQKMLEIEAERKKAIPPSDLEMEKMLKNESLQARAQVLLNEEKDDVKHMNQMMLYAKVVTVRDHQLFEKKDVRGQVQREEKRKDLLMEVERLKTIKYYEELEKFKKEEQRKAAMETIKQMKERELERMRMQEERNKEGQDMIKKIRDIQEEDSKNNLEKKQYQKTLLDQILVENQKAMAGKVDKVRQEKEDEERIARYLIEKAQREAEYQAEQKRIKDEKEREVQRLRELQEKASDRQSEIDSLRAKRAMEGADRQAREKDRHEAEKKAKINQDLMESRQQQSLQKELRLQEQAKNERDEFHRIVHSQKVERELELRMEHEKQARINEHSEQLKKQIALHEEKHKQGKREFLEEGKKMNDKLSNEKKLLEGIKSQKLGQLINLGIANKYTTELAKKKIVI